MLKKSILAVALVAGMGCANHETVHMPQRAATAGQSAETPQVAERISADELALPTYEESELALLPEAPWNASLVPASELPTAVAQVLTGAENHSWCAPLVPAGADQTPARAKDLDGGWAIEFDVRGNPGLRANGTSCRRCGRAAFGVAGTAMTTDELVDFDTGDAPAAAFRDGSTQSVLAEDGVASATISVGGQGCVYQVWSFMGEEHLQGLLEGLRFVELETEATTSVASQ